MTSAATRAVPAFVPAALSASQVGTWEYDASSDTLRCDDTMARLYGLTPAEAVLGVPMTRINAALHPGDRSRGRQKRETMLARGGLFVIEYRLAASEDDPVRWMLARGRYERDAAGLMHGRGIVIDVTESKQDGYAEGQAQFVGPLMASRSPLEEATDHAVAARAAIDRMQDADGRILRSAVDALLHALGRCLARRIGSAAP